MANEIIIKSANPLVLFQQMQASGATLDQLNAFLELRDKFDKSEKARELAADERSFNEAMVKFHLDPPKIWKDKKVQFTTDKGTTSYMHATLGNAAELIAVALAKVGISYEWIPAQVNGQITVTCRLKLGIYSKDTTLSSGPDKSGGKNDIQAIVSAQSYLERHTLLAAAGMATHDMDDDGQSSELPQATLNLVNDILQAGDIEDLKNLYTSAMKTCKKTKEDQPKRLAFMDAFDRRRAELTKAGA